VAATPSARLDDGSYLARVRVDKHTAAALRRAGKRAVSSVTVRVIEYTLTGSAGDEVYRLATSLLDPATAPAAELAALYHQRWEAEGGFAEVKTVQRGGPQGVLRSGCPDGVRQQIWAHLTVPHLTRQLMQAAATRSDPPLAPQRISFRRAQHLIRRSLAASPSSGLEQQRVLAQATALLAAKPNPQRRPRSYPRAIKRRATPYPMKKPEQRGIRHSSNFAVAIRARAPYSTNASTSSE
jgi:hypothetical protein